MVMKYEVYFYNKSKFRRIFITQQFLAQVNKNEWILRVKRFSICLVKYDISRLIIMGKDGTHQSQIETCGPFGSSKIVQVQIIENRLSKY